MRRSALLLAVAEAKRFLQRAEAIEPACRRQQADLEKLFGHRPTPHMQDDISGCPESAAVRRASMDLTRALAKLRRGQ